MHSPPPPHQPYPSNKTLYSNTDGNMLYWKTQPHVQYCGGITSVWDITVLLGNMTSNLPPLSPLPSDDSSTPSPLSTAYSLQSRPSASLLTYWLILALTISSAQTHTRTRVDTHAVCIHCKCHHAAFKIRQLQAWKSLDKVATAGRHTARLHVQKGHFQFLWRPKLKVKK